MVSTGNKKLKITRGRKRTIGLEEEERWRDQFNGKEDTKSKGKKRKETSRNGSYPGDKRKVP